MLFGPTGVGANSAGCVAPAESTIRQITIAATSGMILRTLVDDLDAAGDTRAGAGDGGEQDDECDRDSGATAGRAKKPGASVLR